MNRISRKFKKKFVIFLLAEFLTFAMFGVFHFHKFNFSELSSYKQSDNIPITPSDLSNDFFSYCSIHQFNQSVINYDKSKIEIIKFTNLGNLDNSINDNLSSPLLKSTIVPRAPPV